jgi:hypothetical protein
MFINKAFLQFFAVKWLSASGMTTITTDFSQILICRIFTARATVLRVPAYGTATIVVRAFVVGFVRHKHLLPLILKILPLFDNAKIINERSQINNEMSKKYDQQFLILQGNIFTSTKVKSDSASNRVIIFL